MICPCGFHNPGPLHGRDCKLYAPWLERESQKRLEQRVKALEEARAPCPNCHGRVQVLEEELATARGAFQERTRERDKALQRNLALEQELLGVLRHVDREAQEHIEAGAKIRAALKENE